MYNTNNIKIEATPVDSTANANKCFEILLNESGEEGTSPTFFYICLMCQQQFNFDINPIKHLQDHLNSKIYKCIECNIDFEKFYKLQNHYIINSHNNKNNNNNIRMNIKTKSIYTLKNSIATINMDRSFICFYCDMEFNNPHARLHHLISHVKQLYRCKYCKKQFISNKELTTHLYNYHKPKENCTTTTINNNTNNNTNNNNNSNSNSIIITTTSNKDLIKINKVENQQSIMKCDICSEEFQTNIDFKQHISDHKNGYITIQSTCARSQPQPKIRRNNATPTIAYICDVCGHSFKIKGNLTAHYVTHTKEKNYECLICHKKYSLPYALTQHIRIHTGEYNYHCKLCDKKYHTSGKLTAHMINHTTLRQHSCSFCDMKFKRSGELKAHIRIHTGEKPYRCDLCDRFFRRTNALKNHRRLHTGEKPYACKSCGKGFAQKAGLYGHSKTWKH